MKEPFIESWLHFINMFVFQWLFVRLTKHGVYCRNEFVVKYYSIQGLIYPLTGWHNSYKRPFGICFYLRITPYFNKWYQH